MKYLLILFFALPLFSHAQTDYDLNKEKLQPKIEYYATMYGVSADIMDHIIDKESGYGTNQGDGDMSITCKRTGRPVRARGLVQITSCWWPSVTDAQAYDDDFALDFLGYWLSKGKCRWWSTCIVVPTLAIK